MCVCTAFLSWQGRVTQQQLHFWMSGSFRTIDLLQQMATEQCQETGVICQEVAVAIYYTNQSHQFATLFFVVAQQNLA